MVLDEACWHCPRGLYRQIVRELSALCVGRWLKPPSTFKLLEVPFLKGEPKFVRKVLSHVDNDAGAELKLKEAL